MKPLVWFDKRNPERKINVNFIESSVDAQIKDEEEK